MSEFKTNKISPRKGTTQTIGDSGDTVTVSSGANICNAGTLTVSNLTNSGTITSTGTLTTAGISGGTINNTTGTISGVQGVIDWDTTPKTTGFTAVSFKGYFCNTTSASFTVTLPASPSAGDIIAIKDYANTFDTNKISIAPNGNKIQGSTSTFECTDEGAALNFIYVDSTRGWVLTDASKASDIAEQTLFVTATGGTITTSGDYKIHTFTSPGTFCVSCAGNPIGSNTIDYMVIAGGGGGGSNGGGGGGAGGFRESKTACAPWTASPLATPTNLPVSATAYPVTVGGGGSGGSPGSRQGINGSSSIFSTITSTGGGGGGGGPSPGGNPGGSGGGAGGMDGTVRPGGSGNTPPVSPPQGQNGGVSTAPPGYLGGGGGGAGATGSNGAPAAGGNGGNGVTTSISASPIAYSGGGGGGASDIGGISGSGGSGGGAAGGPIGNNGSNGTSNTGGGGGGGAGGFGPALAGGSGGSGIVIIRYKYQ